MREADILHRSGAYWVAATRDSYTVYRDGLTHATPDSSYTRSPDGLWLAIFRADYLARKAQGRAS